MLTALAQLLLTKAQYAHTSGRGDDASAIEARASGLLREAVRRRL